VKGWGKSLPAGTAMCLARRACNWEQGERVTLRCDLAAAVRVKLDNTQQATNCQRKALSQNDGGTH